jgi:hypothetical protein
MTIQKFYAVTLLTLVTQLSFAANVPLNNPGFENNFSGWVETESASVSNDERSGAKAAKINNSVGQLRQKVAVNPNTNYVLSGYIKGGGRLGVNTGNSIESDKVSGKSNYTLVSVSFNSGNSTEVDIFLKYNAQQGRFDDISLESEGLTNGGSVVVPAKLEAEDYTGFFDTTAGNSRNTYRFDDVDINTTNADGGGYFVGWTANGEYLEYQITVPESGRYKAIARAATIRNNSQFTVAINGNQIGGTQSIPNTGGWQSYQDIEADLGNLSVGDYTLRYTFVGGSSNLNYIEIQEEAGVSLGSTVSIPGKIEAENFVDYFDKSAGNTGGGFNTNVDVDIKSTADTGGGFQVGWFQTNEWLEYSINVTRSGNYEANVRAATTGTGKSYTISIDGTNVTGTQGISQTGNYNIFANNIVDLGFLSAGNHTLRFTNKNQYFDLNFISISEKDDGPVNPPSGDCNIDMSIWGYTLNDGVSRNAKSDIQDLVDNKNLGGDEIVFNNGCVSFKADNIAGTSSGSSFVRSELRELLTRYTNTGPGVKTIQNNWVTSRYNKSDKSNAGGVDGKMTATLKVNTVSVDRKADGSDNNNDQVGRIIVGQIHGIDHEPAKIYYQKLPEHSKGSVFFTVDGSDGKPSDRINVIGYTDKDYSRHMAGSTTLSNPSNGIALGDEWSYEIDLSGNQLKITVWHNGNTYTTADSIDLTKQNNGLMRRSADTNAITIDSYYDDDWMYFKAGIYNQNNSGTTNPAYGEVSFSQIDVEHY